MPTLRHVGIQVKDLGESIKQYKALGFNQCAPRETLQVVKMKDREGNMIELIQGNWSNHIAVNWYADRDGNLIEVVEKIQGG